MTVALRMWNDRRRGLLWWSVGMIGLSFVNVVFYPSFKNQPSLDQLFEDMPESLRSLFGAGAVSLTSPAGYLHSQVFTVLLPIVLLIFAVGVGARAVGGSEDDGTLELLLSNPVTRTRVVLERYVAVVALVIALGVATTVSLVALCAPFGLLEGISIARLLAACGAAVFLALLHASIAFTIGAAFGGRAAAIAGASVVGAAGYIVFGLVSGGVIRGARFFSPWYWYLSRNIIAGGLPPEAILVPLGLALVLPAIGLWAFLRRDLR